MHASHRLSKNCYNIVVILTKRLYRKVQFFLFLRLYMVLRIIPVWTYSKHKWVRTDERAGVTDNTVKWKDKDILCIPSKNELGVESYWYEKDGIYRLFDFSASHLCRRQLKVMELKWN